MRPRGGVFGEALYWGVSSALGGVGAHIVALFLFLAAVLLLTGASIAGVVKATTDSVSSTTRDMRAAVQRRRATEELAALETRRAAGLAGDARAVLVGRGPLSGPLRRGAADRGGRRGTRA